MPVSDTHLDYAGRWPLWRKCRDVVAGQEAVQARGELYLPRLDGQSDGDYGAYKARALFYNASQRTLDGMLGLIFRRAPRVDLPPALDPLSQDVDMAGLALPAFAESCVREVLTVGRCGILADHPPARPELVTAGQAAGANQRPFLRLFRAEDIIDWREGQRHNATVLTQVRLAESVAVGDPEDEFASLDLPQIRVLDLDGEGLYRQRLYRKIDDDWRQAGQDIQPLMNGRRMSFIPFVFLGPKDTRPAVDKPPLLDLVNVNLSHYRSTADLEHGAHFTGLPTAVITGHRLEEGEGLSIGAGEAWVLASPDAEASFLEFKGQGLSTLERRLDAKEAQMAAIGARLLAPDKRAAEAAETMALRRAGENSVLAGLAQAISHGLTRALAMLAAWAGTPGAVRFDLNRDYLPVAMSAQELNAHVAAWQAGALSTRSLFEALQQGEVIAEAVTFEAEEARKAGTLSPGRTSAPDRTSAPGDGRLPGEGRPFGEAPHP